jgi:uncharacterized protein
MITDPLFYAAAVPAVTLLGLAKGGFSGVGLLSMPLLALVVPPVQAAAIVQPILMVQDIVSLWAFRRHWSRRNLAMMLPGAAIGVALGYLLAARVSDAAVALAIGVISISFAIRRLVVERRPQRPAARRADAVRGWFWGAVCGFTSLVAHAGGPPFQIYVMPQRLPAEVFIGTGAVFFALVNWLKVLPYFLLGQFTAENLSTSAALFPLAIAATMMGVWLVRRISGDRLYTIIYALLVLVGGKLAWDGAAGLLRNRGTAMLLENGVEGVS